MKAFSPEKLPSMLTSVAIVAIYFSNSRRPRRCTIALFSRFIASIFVLTISACGVAAKPDEDEQFFKAITQIYGPERNEGAVREWNLRKYKYENLLSRRFWQSASDVEQAIGIFLLPSFWLVSEEMHGYNSASEVMSAITKLATDKDAEPATLWILTKICQRQAHECKDISTASAWPNRDPDNILAYTAAASEANTKGDAREATRILVLGAVKAKTATEYSDIVRVTAANAIRGETGVTEIDARLLAAAIGQMIGPLDVADLGALCEITKPQILDQARREACIKISRLLDRTAPRMMDVVIANMVLKALAESDEEAKSATKRWYETERQIQARGRMLKHGAGLLSACRVPVMQFLDARKSMSERQATSALIKSESCLSQK